VSIFAPLPFPVRRSVLCLHPEQIWKSYSKIKILSIMDITVAKNNSSTFCLEIKCPMIGDQISYWLSTGVLNYADDACDMVELIIWKPNSWSYWLLCIAITWYHCGLVDLSISSTSAWSAAAVSAALQIGTISQQLAYVTRYAVCAKWHSQLAMNWRQYLCEVAVSLVLIFACCNAIFLGSSHMLPDHSCIP